ncbi:Pc22g15110 [Penicillium rubens Wisconsin 54-1255]|uniref:Pc22g15110 protein n=1 Tax=Penicillium rubens (strain ATCC 28089 / DSM 1075 / NRRL 1951 / Wisconsin 54-1255) TaxID=500485 RepID=B6HVN0_PENRW|nr:Pc22g15110 [Penicillium rubens Wisconsin 54-1255]
MVWQPEPLPFTSNSLPKSPLPSNDEIRACTNILLDRVYKVVAINDEIVVKFGGGVKEYEGQVLLFLERHLPTIPAPRLYAMYKDPETFETFLVMQRIPGEPLDAIWPSLTEDEKDDITDKLRQIFDNLRQVPCPKPDFYGGLDGGCLHHYMFHNQRGGLPRSLGPYIGEANFVAGIVGNYRVRYYEEYLPSLLKGHRPTLTHGDVQQKNIMVAENSSGRNAQGGRSFDVVMLDWADAGWYPQYWEFFVASSPIAFMYWDTDWCLRIQQFLEVWPAEQAVMRMLEKDTGL